MTRPDVSIIIPTHNRRASAARALQALSVQCCPGIAVEVILVADGCTDDTASVAAVEWPVFVRVLEQPRAGAAAARNRGAAAAAGHLLIFVDDDVEVLPGFLAAHVEAHAATDRVVIGYLPPQLQGRRPPLRVFRLADGQLLSPAFAVRTCRRVRRDAALP
jgi:glycosyltransferase involved in cell wall biosynthesis